MREDTIVAITTPLGYGGIGVIRVSGANALAMLIAHTTHKKEFIPWRLTRTYVIDSMGDAIDDILAVYMPAPNTFTGEDIVEFQCHGSPVVLEMVMEACLSFGARMATRGEFSKRALLNNRISLSQAEAVLEVINAPDTVAVRMAQQRLSGRFAQVVSTIREQIDAVRMQLYMALDFPEDDLEVAPREGIFNVVQDTAEQIQALVMRYQQERIWQEGASIVLVGSVNAGKSSIMNAILGRSRAIVSDVPGTTRDFLTERISLNGLPVTIMDTAGLRSTEDTVEQLGIEATYSNTNIADAILFVIDSTRDALYEEETEFFVHYSTKNIIIVYNKEELVHGAIRAYCDATYPNIKKVSCSAKDGVGIDAILETARTAITGKSSIVQAGDALLIPNMRQASLLQHAHKELLLLLDDIQNGISFDAIITLLDTISVDLEEVVGYSVSEDLMNRIFDSFCIGK